jgi:hypothetical protein
MEKLEQLIDKIGADAIQEYIKNKTTDKEMKDFIISEIQSCKIELIDNGYYLAKDEYKLFRCNFKTGYFWYDYNKIYLVLIEKYNTNNKKINNIIKGILVDNLKYNELSPNCVSNSLIRNW